MYQTSYIKPDRQPRNSEWSTGLPWTKPTQLSSLRVLRASHWVRGSKINSFIQHWAGHLDAPTATHTYAVPIDAPGPLPWNTHWLSPLKSSLGPVIWDPNHCPIFQENLCAPSKSVPKANSLFFFSITSLTMGLRRLGGNDIHLLGSESEEQKNVIPLHRAPTMRLALLTAQMQPVSVEEKSPRTSAII